MTEPATTATSDTTETQVSLFSRIGLAVVHPRAALALAGDRAHAGRSGSDLLALLGLLVVATELRGVIGAIWLGVRVSWGLAARALVQILQGALTIDLCVLVVAAAIVFFASGRRREIGKSFDLACVALVPFVLVQLVVVVAVRAFDLELPAMFVLAPGLAWTGALLALAAASARGQAASPAIPRSALVAGIAIALVASAGGWWQIAWTIRHVEYVRPLARGAGAPALALPAIGPQGELGAKFTLADAGGKIVVVDFWAVWCDPCLRSMPHLDQLAREHPDVVFVAVALDRFADARVLFDEHHYQLKLLADDGDVSLRYGASTIPHTVVIAPDGRVRDVGRGGELDLDREIADLKRQQAR